MIVSVKECNLTDIRVVGGHSSWEGTVEICRDGLWVPVCDDMWDYREAELVCKQLGHTGSKSRNRFSFTVFCLCDTGWYALRKYGTTLQDSALIHCYGGEKLLSDCVVLKAYECEAKAAVLCTS